MGTDVNHTHRVVQEIQDDQVGAVDPGCVDVRALEVEGHDMEADASDEGREVGGDEREVHQVVDQSPLDREGASDRGKHGDVHLEEIEPVVSVGVHPSVRVGAYEETVARPGRGRQEEKPRAQQQGGNPDNARFASRGSMLREGHGGHVHRT